MATPCVEENYERIEELISEFCAIILTQKDSLDSSDIKKAEQYLDSLSLEDIGHLNLKESSTNPQIRSIVLKKIAEYIKTFYRPSDLAPISFKRPFEFDSGGTYISFCKSCEEYYENKHQRHSFPPVLKFTLQYIQEISEHYRIFGHFYDIRSEQTSNSIVRKMAVTAETKASEVVQKVTQEVADKIVVDKVDTAVEKKMVDVSSKISESSVTILGIFAGIVLTVVAGLFYSSSVLESINTADFYKLLCISSLVGLVCLHLIVAMFRFVARIGEKSEKKFFSDWVIIVITVILIIVMTTGFVLHLKNPTQNTVTDTEESEINANVDVNISYSDTASNDVTNDSEIPETTSDSSTQ